MADDVLWQPLVDELGRWRQAGRAADLWLRDDDAVEPTAALDRLLALAGRHSIPLTLAVIPAHAGEALAIRLSVEALVSVAVHGWAHRNHALPADKKAELGAERPAATVLEELSRAKAVIDRLCPGSSVPVLVPPWNRIDWNLLPLLPGHGFAALSVFGRAQPAPLRMINTHVDIIDWQAGKACRDHATLVGLLVEELGRRFASGSAEPVGILTHHLVHDEAAWAFLGQLFEVTDGQGACHWRSIGELISE
jgi:peptidoglycan/xylan/chitin deacetylase (PgdA/CDA1 family)